jgi:ferredoxin
MHRISVSERCTGHGRCYSAAPDVLEDDDEGLVTLRGGSKLIPDEVLSEAQEAQRACPESAITITPEP